MGKGIRELWRRHLMMQWDARRTGSEWDGNGGRTATGIGMVMNMQI